MSTPELHVVQGGRPREPLDGDQHEDPVEAPTSFARKLSAPAAWPWRQHQIAELDARHGSPLPLDQVAYQLTRIGSWRPAQPAQFTVIYSRAGSGRAGRLGASGVFADLAGALRPGAAPSSRSTGLPLVALCYAAAALVLGFAVCASWRDRVSTGDQLAELQARSSKAERLVRKTLEVQRQSQTLMALGVGTRSTGRVLSDVAWVSKHLAPGVAVEGFHWRSGVAAVEVANPGPAFIAADRRVQRASKPLRAGVWLWGVEPASPGLAP